MPFSDLRHTVVHGLKVIHERQDVLVAHRHPLQHCNLIPDHVLATRHQAFVDDFGSIVSARVNMYALLDDTVRASAECLPSLVPARLDLRLRHPAVIGREMLNCVAAGRLYTPCMQ